MERWPWFVLGVLTTVSMGHRELQSCVDCTMITLKRMQHITYNAHEDATTFYIHLIHCIFYIRASGCFPSLNTSVQHCSQSLQIISVVWLSQSVHQLYVYLWLQPLGITHCFPVTLQQQLPPSQNLQSFT